MKRFQQGLTMIELMIVVPIMGILAAVAPPAFALYDDRKTQSYEMPDFIFSLYDRRTQTYFCQATRVSKDFLLTAAHCFFDGYKYTYEAGNTVLVSFSGEKVSYYAGLVREVILRPKYSEKQRTIVELQLKKKADPSFIIPGGGYALINPFDLALIKVDSSQLPDAKEYPDLFSGRDLIKVFDQKRVNEILVYSHYRHLSKLKSAYPNIKLEKMVMSLWAPGNVIVIDYKEQSWLNVDFENSPDQHICQGDSGSGAFIKNETTQNKITLVGVASSGGSIDDSYTCMKRVAFAPISYENTTWIESVMRK
jgi:prepilin-type N-terminal cleavage/methylation domain-containing protein